jgi:N-glycosylase/DNA lyase
MITNMSKKYGTKVDTVENEDGEEIEMWSFPTIQDLAKDGVEQELRELGFGYRAKYIYKSACHLAGKSENWLTDLKSLSTAAVSETLAHIQKARTCLLELSGVGPKVADCILLMRFVL